MILDIIISVYNKEKSISNYYNKLEEELKNIKHRIIFVDDASNDKTLEVLKEIQKENEATVKIISLAKKHDKDTSIYAGLCNITHDLVCIVDLDLQANISYISKMYEFITTHTEYDQVCMYSNYVEKSFIKRNKIKVLNKLYDLNIDNNRTYYRIMRKNVVNALTNLSQNYPFNLYSFEILGFNTYYFKFDNSNIDNDNNKKYICYTSKPFSALKKLNLFFIVVLSILFIISLFIKVGSAFILLLMILLNLINLYYINLTGSLLNKEKTYFIIKEKIGFDENVL